MRNKSVNITRLKNYEYNLRNSENDGYLFMRKYFGNPYLLINGAIFNNFCDISLYLGISQDYLEKYLKSIYIYVYN